MGRGKEGTLSINHATPNKEFFLTKQYCTYAYDGLYRLTHHESRQTDEAGPVLLSEDFRYDSEGNLLQLGPRTTLAYADAIHPGRATTVRISRQRDR